MRARPSVAAATSLTSKKQKRLPSFLSLIGATSSMLKFEDIRIMRDMRNSVNRIVNCENANFNKVADAANRQIESIKYLDKKIGLNNLPVKLQEIAIARMAHPEVSLKNLANWFRAVRFQNPASTIV